MKPTTFAIAIAIAFFASLATTVAQEHSPATGTEFWLVFQKNFRDWVVNGETMQQEPAHPLMLELSIVAEQGAKGTVEIPGFGISRTFVAEPGSVLRVSIDTAVQVRSGEVIEKLAVHVTSSTPVKIYAVNRRFQTTDSYLAYPVTSLGTTYRAVGYEWLQDDLLSQFAVVATEDETTVQITPSVRTLTGRPAGKPFTVKLDAGDVYQVIPHFDPRATSDLTGSLVDADKPVALFSGHNCAYVPDRRTKACNLLVEQLLPIDSWGTTFVVGPLLGPKSSVYRIVASENRTTVKIDGKEVAWLEAGEYFHHPAIKEPALVESSRPVMVVQYAKGYDVSSERPATPHTVELPTFEEPVDNQAKEDPVEVETTIEVEPNKQLEQPAEQPDLSELKQRVDSYRMIMAVRAEAVGEDEEEEVVDDRPVVTNIDIPLAKEPERGAETSERELTMLPFKEREQRKSALSATDSSAQEARAAMQSEPNRRVRVAIQDDAKSNQQRNPDHLTFEIGDDLHTPELTIEQHTPARPRQTSEVIIASEQIGDPMMIMIPPVSGFASSCTIYTPVAGDWSHRVNIIVPAGARKDLRINGRPLVVAHELSVAGGKWYVLQIEVPAGLHTVTGSKPFGAYSYGFGYGEFEYDAYGHGE